MFDKIEIPPVALPDLHRYNQDLKTLRDISNNSIDIIVSTSSLEHNTPENLRLVVGELTRVLKPGGRLIATPAAAKENDWHHFPSHSWCYTDDTLRSLFRLAPDTPSNYTQIDDPMESTRIARNCVKHRHFNTISVEKMPCHGVDGIRPFCQLGCENENVNASGSLPH